MFRKKIVDCDFIGTTWIGPQHYSVPETISKAIVVDTGHSLVVRYSLKGEYFTKEEIKEKFHKVVCQCLNCGCDGFCNG